MTFSKIEQAAAADGLSIVGAFHPEPEDDAPEGVKTLCLLGAGSPAMWEAFSASHEYSDNQPHPLDRWSERVIGALAATLGGVALFPFGGPPWQPFQKWAEKGEGATASPVLMQVTWQRGLWTSYRGALGLRDRIAIPAPRHTSPCLGCDAPCLDACPVNALGGGTYDVPACTGHLRSKHGSACLDGCLVRKSCPYSASMALPPDQRKFHIAAFLRSNR